MTDSIWSRGGSNSNISSETLGTRGGFNSRGSGRGRGNRGGTGNSSYSNPNFTNDHSQSISMNGLRMAKGQIGKIPSEMELLASPSRGLDTSDSSSLKNPEIQDRFRQHIAEKLIKFDKEYQDSMDSISKASALSIIILDFRKLREGITSSGRVDLFTAEVYESSARLAIYAGNMQQLGACLPHLVFTLHPSILLPAPPLSTDPTVIVTEELESLSLTNSTTIPKRIIPELHYFYQSLYLLYLISYLAEVSSFHSTFSTFLSSSSSSSIPTDLILANQIYNCLLTSNYTSLTRLIYPSKSTFIPHTKLNSSTTSSSLPPLSPIIKLDLQLALLKFSLPNWRERAWERLERSYKVFDDFVWLGRALLFEEGDEKGVKEFLKTKGKSV